MNILENWGVRKIQDYYYKRDETPKYGSIKDLFNSKIIWYSSILAFFIGFVLTLPIIFLELKWQIFSFENINLINIFIYAITLTFLIFLEFYFLFLLSFYILAYYFYNLTHINNQKNSMSEEAFLAMMSRTTMELSEGYEENFNIEHKELSNKKIAIFTLMYKIKVVATNFVLKFIAKKALTRTSFRLYTPYVAALGTGVWDAVVFYKVIKHAQYKIMVRYAILYLIEHKMMLLSKEENIKAILSRYYYYSEYNNNFAFLLHSIYEHTPFDYNKELFLEKDVYEQCNTPLLLLLFAYKEKIHTKIEKEIIKSIDQKTALHTLRKAFKSGDYEYIKHYIDEIK